jgi:hypothetical protein
MLLALVAAASVEPYPAQAVIDQWRSICSERSPQRQAQRAAALAFDTNATMPDALASAVNRWRENEIAVRVLRGEVAGRPTWLILRYSAAEEACDLQDLAADRADFRTVATTMGANVVRVFNGGYGELSHAELRPSLVQGADEVSIAYWPPPDDGVPTGLTLQAVRRR